MWNERRKTENIHWCIPFKTITKLQPQLVILGAHLERRWVWQNFSDTVILFKLLSVAFVEITVTHCDFA